MPLGIGAESVPAAAMSCSLGVPSLDAEEDESTLENIDAQLIVNAKKLSPLNAREPPQLSASTCVHPPKQLQGGGNKSASYIVCKMCHSRSENPHSTPTELKNILKEEKKVVLSKVEERKGRLSQEEHDQDSREDRQDESRHGETETGNEREGDATGGDDAVSAEDEPGQAQRQMKKEPGETWGMIPQCHCKRPAEKLVVKKGGPSRGREFWKCEQMECDFVAAEGLRCDVSRVLHDGVVGGSHQGKDGCGYGIFEVSAGYEVWEADQWKKREGRIPKEEHGKIRVEVCLTNKALEEQMQEDDREAALGRKLKKKIMRSMECFMSKAAVTEVYSPPRVAKAAEAKGMSMGSSIDLSTGWDLNQPAEAKRVWQTLEAEDPDLVVISPPCKALCQMQNIIFPRMGKVMAMQLVADGLHHESQHAHSRMPMEKRKMAHV
eukprot:s2377_g13.t1